MPLILKECEYCKNGFYIKPSLLEHKILRGDKSLTCSKTCSKLLIEIRNKSNKKIYNKTCQTCNKAFVTDSNGRWRKFCGKECVTKRILSKGSLAKTSNSLREYFKNKPKFPSKEKSATCSVCKIDFLTKSYGKKTCSKNCLHIKRVEDGKKSQAIRKNSRRSKNEIYFYELCKQIFQNVLANEKMFNGWDADIILKDYKIAILWNGVWHYKKVCGSHSLAATENRDKIKMKEIHNSGFVSYVVKDMGKFNKNFVQKEFEKFKVWLAENSIFKLTT